MDIDVKRLTTRKSNINLGILGKNQAGRFAVVDIDIDDLIPSEDNFYSLSGIDSLKESIEEFGLQQNLTVVRRGKKYEIISGHRRHEACRLLVKEGKTKFQRVPCRIMDKISETMKNILLITMNSETRKKTTAEVTEEVERLKLLYEDYKKENPNFTGRVREAIAKDLGLSAAAVGMHEKISNNLEPELKEAYKAGDIAFTAAAELASLAPEDQKAVYEKTDGSAAAVKKERKKKERLPAQPEPQKDTLEYAVIGAKEFAKKLAILRQEYIYLEGKIEAVDRVTGPLETIIKNLYQDIAAIEAGILGEPMFKKGGD